MEGEDGKGEEVEEKEDEEEEEEEEVCLAIFSPQPGQSS
jgi:hypothetical protein